MANQRIRGASILVGGVKEGTFVGAKYNFASGDEMQFADPGYAGHSDGAEHTTITAQGIDPVEGRDFDFYSAVKLKKYLDVAVATIDGKIHQITMRCVEIDVDWDHKTGACKGEIKLEGGGPNITG